MQLGDRMKEFEAVSKLKLMRRVPVIIRLDGKAFHTLTRGMDRPFDFGFMACMVEAAKAVCAEVQGCQLAYVQSDEISLLVTDWEHKDTSAWFDNQVQKLCSVSAAICTAAFLHEFRNVFPERPKLAAFDARVFNLPVAEVCNYFIWRQQDATRNSINMLAQAHFSHKALHGKNVSEVQDMLMLQKGINWNDCAVPCKRGTSIINDPYTVPTDDGLAQWSRWVADLNIPIFTKDRAYIERFVAAPEWMS